MTKLEKLADDLAKARRKRDEWDQRAKDLEARYEEEEKNVVHSMYMEAKITPEQLAQIIAMAKAGQVGIYPEGIQPMNSETAPADPKQQEDTKQQDETTDNAGMEEEPDEEE